MSLAILPMLLLCFSWCISLSDHPVPSNLKTLLLLFTVFSIHTPFGRSSSRLPVCLCHRTLTPQALSPLSSLYIPHFLFAELQTFFLAYILCYTRLDAVFTFAYR
ncbi:hypothetical protein HGRIS_012313 [Hohenbuehelia grisea]|uniref:Secreted protein n=1 Tax=Hohenbuehelia grisea TaxID=104357 RepID=A0ABR3IRW3_9AGAR